MGAPRGNTNGARDKRWERAIAAALEERSRVNQWDALQRIAHVLLNKCAEGDMGAIKELGDRLDGRPAQIVGGSDELGPVRIVVEWQPKA